MATDVFQSMAYIHVGPQQVVVFVGIPFLERRKFLRNRGEQTDDDTHWCGLHVVAEFSDNLLVLFIIRGATNEYSCMLTGIR